MQIRKAVPQDWQSLRDVRLRALADAPDAFRQTLAEASAQPERYWRGLLDPRPEVVQLVAERDGAAVGMAVVVLEPDADHANLYAMWVAPEARGAGAGRALVDAALAWARSRAVLEVVLQVTEGNNAARRLYLDRGFVETGERERLREGSPLHIQTLRLRLPPLIMGVVNVTPDSFSDGGAYFEPASAIEHGLALRADGADILDIGGEATNPSAMQIDAAEELRRVVPVIEALAAAGATVSIDTTKATVARAAVEAGASIVNDVSGGLFDPAMAAVLTDLDATYIAGHLRGHNLSEVFGRERAGEDASIPWSEVAGELADRLAVLAPAVRARAWIDPGLGFGKGANPEGNLDLIRHAGDLGRAVGRPVVVGPSRKRFLRRVVGGAPAPRTLDVASTVACLGAVRRGARVLRVHEVAALRAALAVDARL